VPAASLHSRDSLSLCLSVSLSLSSSYLEIGCCSSTRVTISRVHAQKPVRCHSITKRDNPPWVQKGERHVEGAHGGRVTRIGVQFSSSVAVLGGRGGGCSSPPAPPATAARPDSRGGCGWRKVAGGGGGAGAGLNGPPWGARQRAATGGHPPAAPPVATSNVSSHRRSARLEGRLWVEESGRRRREAADGQEWVAVVRTTPRCHRVPPSCRDHSPDSVACQQDDVSLRILCLSNRFHRRLFSDMTVHELVKRTTSNGEPASHLTHRSLRS
jgi:hypothetical protein